MRVQPVGQFGFGPLQSRIIQELAQKRDGNGAGTQIEAIIFLGGTSRTVDLQLFIEPLQSVLDATQREVSPTCNRPICEPKSDINEDFVFAVRQTVRVAEAPLLKATDLAVDHTLAFDEDAAQRKLQPVI